MLEELFNIEPLDYKYLAIAGEDFTSNNLQHQIPTVMKSTALTAAFCNLGIRVYTKTSEGDIREGRNDTTDYVLASAQAKHDSGVIDLGDGWFPGELRFTCSRDSALCAFAWASWSQSIFYQMPNGSINERKYISNWEQTSFVEPGCLKGTNIAAVHSEDARYICLFFQDEEGWIRYRSAKDFSYASSVRICKAARDCRDIGLYFQDDNNALREFRGGRDTDQWKDSGSIVQLSHPVGSISAVSQDYHGIEVKILFQDDKFDIIEMHQAGGAGPWVQGDFRVAAFPHSDIIAYIRTPNGAAPFFVVMWAGKDNVHSVSPLDPSRSTHVEITKVLWQKVNSWGAGWLKETPIAFLQTTGTSLGSWKAPFFTDNASHAESKVICQLRINSGVWVDGLALDFTDGSSTSWHGGPGGAQQSFPLNSGEDFTHVFVTADGNIITALQLVTSKGRSTPWYGIKTGAVTYWELEGRALAGFAGSSQNFLYGLMPIWSERYSTASLTNLQSCVAEGEQILKEHKLDAARYEQLKSLTDVLRYNIDSSLRAPAEHAVHGLVTLSGSVEGLHNKTHQGELAQQEETKTLVRLCKSQAFVVANRFEFLYEQSRAIMNQSIELSTELTTKLGELELRMMRLGKLQVVVEDLKKGAETTMQIMSDREKTALISMQSAERTRQEAERADAEIGRVIRDIFTLGIGRLSGWNNRKEAIAYAEKQVESSGRLLQQSQDDLRRVQAAVSRIASEIDEFGKHAVMLTAYREQLMDTATHGIVLRERTTALTDHTLTVLQFLAGLAAKSGAVRTKLTTAQFSKAVSAIKGLIDPQERVNGLLVDGTERLDETLEMIAASDAVAEKIDDSLM
ncbi:hypothetical protein BDW22DRAFT_1487136 [Trametopsis cervina]|nr:hypothetical protein BDW22DRAFT_1487136 [Trametopsis cervina]